MKRTIKIVLIILYVLLSISVPVSAKVKISPTSVNMIKGEKIKLKVKGTKKKIKWSVKNKKIVSISKKGFLTAKKKGTTTIYVKVGNKKYSRKVTVYLEGEYFKGTYKSTSSDDIYVGTDAGNTKGGRIPVIYSKKPPKGYSNLMHIGVVICTPKWGNYDDESDEPILPYWIYIDHVRVGIKNVQYKTISSFAIQYDTLKNGKHTVEVVQYENNDPKKTPILYKRMYYRVKEY